MLLVSSLLKFLLHCEQPGAATFWLINTVCVWGGGSCKYAWEIQPQERKASEALLKPCARTGGFPLPVGQSLLETRKELWWRRNRKELWWGRNPAGHFPSLWSSGITSKSCLFSKKGPGAIYKLPWNCRSVPQRSCDWRHLLARMETGRRNHPTLEWWGLVGTAGGLFY